MRRPILKPGRTHPITVTPNPRRVTVTADGRTIVDTTRALTLQEAGRPAVLYVPREDTDMTALEPSASHTYCPYKGQASHFDVVTEDGRISDAVWSYEDPNDALPEIAGRLAFHPHLVQVTEH